MSDEDLNPFEDGDFPWEDEPDSNPFEPSEAAVDLRLTVSDSRVTKALTKFPEGRERNEAALLYIGVGVAAVEDAEAQRVRLEGERALSSLKDVVAQHSINVGNEVGAALHLFSEGRLTNVLENFSTEQAREFERTSTRIHTEAQQKLSNNLDNLVGANSSLMRALHPEEGIGREITQATKRLLERQEAEFADQLSFDNDSSPLSRLAKTAEESNAAFVLDLKSSNEGFLTTVRASLNERLELNEQRTSEFQAHMLAKVSDLVARREVTQKSPRKGLDFEESVGELLAKIVLASGDFLEHTGNTGGRIARCKVGDYVAELGSDRPAPGCRVVFEAKSNQSSSLRNAQKELDVARRNRDADVGVFIFDRNTAPKGLPVFSRFDGDIYVVWDSEDVNSDIVIEAAYSFALHLCTASSSQPEPDVDRAAVEEALRQAETDLQLIMEILAHAKTGITAAEHVQRKGQRMHDSLSTQLKIISEGLMSGSDDVGDH